VIVKQNTRDWMQFALVYGLFLLTLVVLAGLFRW
jgi:hypothetical protein